MRKFQRFFTVALIDSNPSPPSLPNPVVLPELVFREDSRGRVTPLMFLFGFIHCLLIGFLCLRKLIVLSNYCLTRNFSSTIAQLFREGWTIDPEVPHTLYDHLSPKFSIHGEQEREKELRCTIPHTERKEQESAWTRGELLHPPAMRARAAACTYASGVSGAQCPKQS